MNLRQAGASETKYPPALKDSARRVFAVWTLWMWLAWLDSREVLRIRELGAAIRHLLRPPWPHAGEAFHAALAACAGAGLVSLACLGAGLALIRLIRLSRAEEGRPDILLALAAGLPIVALLAQGLGLLGLAQSGVLAAILVPLLLPPLFVLPATGVEGIRHTIRETMKRAAESRHFPLALINLLALGIVASAAIAPETAWDAVVYHLRVPSLYLHQHKVCPVPEIFPSFFPFTGEMLMTLAMNIGGDPAARLLHAIMWAAAGLVVSRLAERAWGPAARPWALALYLTLPMGQVIACRAYVEFFLLLPLVSSLLVLLSHQTGPGSLALAGWLAGTAFGTKYAGGTAAAVVGALVLVRSWPRTRPMAIFCAAAFVSSVVWPLRNALWTGNPFYPLLFGGPRWTPIDTAGWMDDASAFNLDFGLLLTAPWRLLSRGTADGGISPMLFSAIAVPLLWPSVRSKPLWPLALALFLLWWLTSPLARYLMPALALLCAAAAGVVNGHGLNDAGTRWLKRLNLIGLAGSLACGMSAIQFATMPYEAAFGKLSAREYRSLRFRPVDYVQVLETLEHVVPPDGRVYILGHNFSYNLPRRVWFDFLYTRPALYWWIKDAARGGPARIWIRAKQARLTHIAWHPIGARAILGGRPWLMPWSPALLKAYAAFWRAHVRAVERLPNWVIFEIVPQPGHCLPPPGGLPGTEGAGP